MNAVEELMSELKYEKPKQLYTPEMIHYRINDALEMIPEKEQVKLCRALSLLPYEVIDLAINDYVFISMHKEIDGQYFSFKNIWFKGKKGFILLNQNLWNKAKKKMEFTVAHELAHAYKGHLVIKAEDTELKASRKREKGADRLAVKWLSRHYKKEDLMKYCYSEKELK